jgi:hypothetical protein
MNDSGKLLLKATTTYYKSKRDEALASLNVFLNNSVGVADHSNFLEEIKKWIEVLTDAEDNLATLHRHFESDDD